MFKTRHVKIPIKSNIHTPNCTLVEMYLRVLLPTAIAFLSMAISVKAYSPVSSKSVTIAHVTIVSNRTFEATKTAVEANIPPLNTTYSNLLRAGNLAGASAALAALPVLNQFIIPARDFGLLTSTVGVSRKAVQYEIGNPRTAVLMAQYQLGVALYAPIRVALIEEPRTHVVKFIFDSPSSTFGQLGDRRVDAIAADLTKNLTQTLLAAGGW